MRRGGFSLVLRFQTLKMYFFVVCFLMFGILLYSFYPKIHRSVYGIPSGVRLSGYSMGGLLEEELYDVVASLAEYYGVEARNALWDSSASAVSKEQVGRVVDIKETVEAIKRARSGEEVDFVFVQVLPSITKDLFRPIYRGLEDTPKVSLMVNVDWGDAFIPAMLDTFSRFSVTTTWFLTGRWANRSPELARQIATRGHEVGNHGMQHTMASSLSKEEIKELILKGEEVLVQVTGQKPLVFAPPAGDFNQDVVIVAAELGYKTVLWTIDTVDWQRPAPTVIVDRVFSRVSNGALVLLHPTKPTMEALPILLQGLMDRGFSVVTVSELVVTL